MRQTLRDSQAALKRREAAVPSLGHGEGRVAGRRQAVPEHEVLSSQTSACPDNLSGTPPVYIVEKGHRFSWAKTRKIMSW